MDRNNAALQFNLGNAFRQLGQLRDALNGYQKALEIDSKLAIASFSMGLVAEQLGEVQLAEKAYFSAASDNQYALDSYLKLSTLMLKRKSHQKGMEYAKAGLKSDKNCVPLLLCLMSHASALKRHENAKGYAERVLELSPDNVQAKRYLGESLCRLSKTDLGLSILSEASAQSIEGLLTCFPGLVFYTRKDNIAGIAEYAEKVASILREKRDLPPGLVIELAFPLARYLHDRKEHEASLSFLNLANRLKRQTFRYDIHKMDHYFALSLQYGKVLGPPETQESHSPGLIFIVGLPRSGTSLVEQILSSHSQAYGCGELESANRARAKIEKEFGPQAFEGRNKDIVLDRFRDEYQQGLSTFEDSPIYIDKMPENFQHIPLLLSAFPQAKVVLCTRNILENAFSIYRQNFQGMHPYAYKVAELKHYVSAYLKLMEEWKKDYGAFIHEVSYEALVNDQESVTRELLAACDLPFEAACLEFHENTRVVNTASSAQVKQKIYRSSMSVVESYPDFLAEWNASEAS